MTGKIDKGRSMLNATDEKANPYGLVLSEKERDFIYERLNRLDHTTDAILNGKTGWKQQGQATFSTAAQFVGVGLVAIGLHRSLDISTASTFVVGISLIVLQKLNLLLTHESIEDIFARRNRQDEKEAKERSQYFKDMGCKD